MVLEGMEDEGLMEELEKERKERGNDYPIRAVWNSLWARVVFQHKSVESLRRELLRNAELRYLCGFSVLKGGLSVPPSWVYTRFLKKLLERQDRIVLEVLQNVNPDSRGGCPASDVSLPRLWASANSLYANAFGEFVS